MEIRLVATYSWRCELWQMFLLPFCAQAPPRKPVPEVAAVLSNLESKRQLVEKVHIVEAWHV